MNKPVRVAFVLFHIHLLGMHNYLRNLFAAIQSLPGEPLVPVVFGSKAQTAPFAGYPGLQIVNSRIFERRTLPWLLRKLTLRVSGRDILLTRLLQRHGIGLLSHSSHLGSKSQVPVISWIADLQHMHLPELFTADELASREAQFQETTNHSDAVIVGSDFGLQDFSRFSPANAHKGRVLKFIASPLTAAGASDLSDLQARYGFTGPYFMLPNHFWKHKNHAVVIEALRILQSRGEPVCVLASGSTVNTSYPEFVGSLLARAKANGVEPLFRPLGVIPFSDIIGLMEHAVAILNPSLFEGWSTSVEEAKTMGKQVVLSDIPVHREQAPPRGFYFDPHDAGELANAMSAALAAYDTQADIQQQKAALAVYPQRLQIYGNAYRTIVEDVLLAAERPERELR
jgi:glycosyltransferase involved in cell wall biosynthesis